jgi:hypothetical protein
MTQYVNKMDRLQILLETILLKVGGPTPPLDNLSSNKPESQEGRHQHE